jgi:dihydropteroate synthase
LAAERSSRPAPPPIKCGQRILRFEQRPLVMGVLNVTPDSFSDGGVFYETETAVEHALKMVAEGADLIDIGGESSRPGSDPVSAQQEADRVLPVIEHLVRWSKTPISIDTCKASVARQALDAGAAMVNDISALGDPDMSTVVAASQAPTVLMHMRGTPRTMQSGEIVYSDLMGELCEALQAAADKAEQAGLAPQNVILDPGIGFGKTVEHNLTILNRLDRILDLGRPVLVGTSRKSFIGKVLGVETGDRLLGTAATMAVAAMHGAHILRVHDVTAMRQVIHMCTAIRDERPSNWN